RAVSISAVGAGNAAWTRHAHGVTRRTPYGHETITLAANAAEQLSTVDRHLGSRTWSWHLGGTSLKPKLRVDGGVSFGPGVATRILPVSIYDQSGRDVTPAGLRWSLRKATDGWRLELPLDDAALPLPYVIDPASVSSVTATATSLAAGAKANWTAGFTTSNSGALAAAGTITVAFPTWTGGTIPAAPSIVLLSPASFVTTCTAAAATVATTVTITLASASGQTSALAKNTAATLEIVGITNTTTTGAKTISVSTSADTSANASPSPSIVAATTPAATISFAGNTQAAAAVTTWTVG